LTVAHAPSKLCAFACVAGVNAASAARLTMTDLLT